MSGNSELFEAMKMFKEGLSQYHTTEAVNDARTQLNSITDSAKNEGELLQRTRALGQDLALRLTSAGASPDKVQAAVGELAPPASVTQTNHAQQQMQTETIKKDLTVAREHNATLLAIAGLKNTADKNRPEHEVKFLKDQNVQFNQFAKKPMAALDQIATAKEVILTGNPIGDKSVTNFLARASGEVGALTEADKAPFGGSTAMTAKIAQASENLRTGKFTPENRKLVSSLLDTYEKANTANLERLRKDFSKRAMVGVQKGKYNISESDILQSLGGQASPAASSAPNQNAAHIVEAVQWLASDEAAHADAATRKAVADKIKKLQGGQ